MIAIKPSPRIAACEVRCAKRWLDLAARDLAGGNVVKALRRLNTAANRIGRAKVELGIREAQG